MVRVRFAPSPTGYLHIGSARTFIFNWLYARHCQGTVVLRIDDTDTERNTVASLNSIMDGLKWLNLSWDEFYRQSERLDLHKKLAFQMLASGHAYRDFTPASGSETEERTHEGGPWLFNPEMRAICKDESEDRAAAGEPFVIRYRVPRENPRDVVFEDLVYGTQSKSTADIEDFALLRSNGMPTYHLASCADDIDLNISHIIRGQDHLTNTFKHVLIFECAGAPPQFAHLPLLIAPDGAKLSKRKHGPVVSVTTYRDFGFLPISYINFLCLLGWSPKDNREQMTLNEITSAFSLDGVNRSNAVVNFSEADPIDPKALWLNSQHLRSAAVAELMPLVKQTLEASGLTPPADEAHFAHIIETIRTRFSTLLDFPTKGRAYFSDDFAVEPASREKLDTPGARELLHELGDRIAANPEFTEASVEADVRKLAADKGVKAGLLINGSRAALTGQPVGPSAFAVFLCIGRERVIERLRKV